MSGNPEKIQTNTDIEQKASASVKKTKKSKTKKANNKNNSAINNVKNPRLSTPPRTSMSSTAAAVAKSPATTSPKTSKKPRRSKRSDNSTAAATATTCLESEQQLNPFDIVLQESQDLMQAAMEAQQLGRLKMSSTYLLLLHARLIGLGKRFDRAQVPTSEANGQGAEGEATGAAAATDPPNSVATSKNEATDPMEAPKSPPQLRSKSQNPQHDDDPETMVMDFSSPPPSKRIKPNSAAAAAAPANIDDLFTPKTQAAKKLANMLPNNIEWDQAMMEHLARAAVQLHAARSGKTRRQQMYNPRLKDDKVATSTEPVVEAIVEPAVVPTKQARAFSFTVQEYKMLHAAAHNTSQPPNLTELAFKTGRPAHQIGAFLRNLDTKKRLAAELELGEQPKSQRGRKPFTAAIHTAPQAVCDARTLLRGNVLESNDEEEENVEKDEEDQEKEEEEETKEEKEETKEEKEETKKEKKEETKETEEEEEEEDEEEIPVKGVMDLESFG